MNKKRREKAVLHAGVQAATRLITQRVAAMLLVLVVHALVHADAPQDCRGSPERADACTRLAETAISEATRETMLFLAHRWQALADQETERKKGVRPKDHDGAA